MNNIFKYGSIAEIPLYNCSAHTPEEWSERDGVRRPLYGLADMTYGLVFNLLYIPILSVLFEKENMRMSCFKIMIFLASVDMLALWVNSIITGFLAYKGAVYCTYPNLIYIAGSAGLSLWCCSCIIAMSLVINRLLELAKPTLAAFLFEGCRTYIFMGFAIGYGCYFAIFTPPIVFSSKYHTWFFDPMIFVNRTDEYANIPHGVNNFLVVGLTCLLYVSFCFVLGRKLKQVSNGGSSKSNKMSTQIFIQSAMICAINQIASIIYVIMNFIDVPFWLIIVGHSFWQFGHGAPAIIYLCLNKTIRNGIMKKIGLKKSNPTTHTTKDSNSAAFTKTN
ncbi:Serpentine Receptor, class T [Caenorhabditis elegans]|uniref:Serpentine Receptor, class T n=1 Tax=Caenorhabditis elegans TaxID=6239 RepID=O01890_CAEEL|nr:Serpentine Receptor, class T [Caenorhabditis elegans]CCD72307.1 Serpentine Receptor, class T [Caenorhabditis elegans]|eukprot:NP_504050.1 Serpentine Receptor, class T [Caenorhabditis elegans]